MLFCYPHGINPTPKFTNESSGLADDLIAQEMRRERGVLKYRLRKAGIPFHSEAETNDLVTLMALFSVH